MVEYSKKFPKAKLRIIYISNSEDIKSTQKAYNISIQLIEDKIVLDSFLLKKAKNNKLQTLSYLTREYKFHPNSIEKAIAIYKLEPVLSQLERPDIVLPFLTRYSLNNLQRRLKNA